MKDRFFGLFCQTDKYKTVDAKEFATFIKDTVNLTFLDVRTAAEHAEGFIPLLPQETRP